MNRTIKLRLLVRPPVPVSTAIVEDAARSDNAPRLNRGALAGEQSKFSFMIRSAKSKDIPEIQSLMNSVQGIWQNGWRSDVLERSLRSSDGLTFVYTENKRIVGFVCAHDLGFRGYLSELVIAKTYQRRGIGKKLVKQVEKYLTKRGCEILVADVWKDAEGFYVKLGWSPPDVILLRKKLS